ncbi:hypothetical protein M0R72_05905 [Candidatus Pacearchaeota archaeon]|jgi:hypothetical protein|nr:hypothetical protein [Candidatus Pacearchaeota archaeon]
MLTLRFQIYDDEAEPDGAKNIYSIELPLGESLPEGVRTALNEAMSSSMDEEGRPITQVTSLVMMSLVLKGLMAKLPIGVK